jgi:predicted phage baseplate assembly protein
VDHGDFLDAMLDRLSSPDHPALRGLTVRTTDDPSIALLDAAAVVDDLLTFHTERIAAEGYLRTAADRRSLGLLGRLVDYRPRPGLAADTHLAYKLDERSQGDADVLIPRGSLSRSVPGTSGEQPQAFETDADLIARAAWNELAVLLHRPGILVPGDLDRLTEILVAGTNTRLVAGDRLLFVFGTGDTATLRLIATTGVTVDREHDVTAVGLPVPAPATAADAPADALTALFALRVTDSPFGATAPLQPVRDDEGRVINLTDWPLPGATLSTTRIVLDTAGRAALRAELIVARPEGTVQHAENLPTEATTINLGDGQITLTGTAEATTVDWPTRRLIISAPAEDRLLKITVDGRQFELTPGDEEKFTDNDQQISLRYASGTQPASVEIAIATVPGESTRKVLSLNAVHNTITPGSPVVIDRAGRPLVITHVLEARIAGYAQFGITGRGTQLVLADAWLDEHDVLLSQTRDTTVYAAGDELEPAGEPVVEDVRGNRVELATRPGGGLRPGRLLAVTGPPGTEIVVVAAVEDATIVLTEALTRRYPRDSVRILGNVVPAGSGETRDEPIGSGDAAAANQSFTLWQEPLTWLPADNPLGARPALEVRVDGLLWQAADSLAGRGPAERVYVLGATPDGRTTITFGDGVNGARLPSGPENVRARYRFGPGAAGNLPANRITQAVTRPLGVVGVTNPIPATGGADADGPGLARRRIPLTVSTLDRLVAVQDYAELARSRVGIGRAAAREVFDGRRRVVHVTVAGVDDVPIASDSDLLSALRAALAANGDPRLPVRVDVRELIALRLAAGVKVAPGHTWELVEPRLREALLHRLGYAGRELAQDAYLSDILAVADRTAGVDYVDVAVFSTPAGPDEPLPVVKALPARGLRPAQFAVLGPDDLTLMEIA